MNDQELLRDYVDRNSEEAFRGLVSRHMNLVYSVALRQVHDSYLAEDVVQAVFIALAKKAHRIALRSISPSSAIVSLRIGTICFQASSVGGLIRFSMLAAS